MSLDAIKTALYTWMARESSLTIIFSRQGKPRPPYPYGEINFTSPAQRVGSIDETRPDGSGGFTTNGLRTATVSLNIYGHNANDKMSALRDSLDRNDVVEEFAAAEIAHLGEEGPNDLTVLEDTSYPERSQMDLTLMFAVERTTEILPIESVEIEAEIEFLGENNTLVITRP